MQHDLPIVTQSALNRTKEMNEEWAQLKAKADAMNTVEIPAFNKLCWEAGIGAVWKN
jgi:hypothetical protein